MSKKICTIPIPEITDKDLLRTQQIFGSPLTPRKLNFHCLINTLPVFNTI